MGTENERMRILEMINKGEISTSEGASRLDDLARNANKSEDAPETDDRMAILGKIESGKISPEEGARRLQEISHQATSKVAIGNHSSPNIDPEDLRKWKRWWTIPLWTGIGITILSGLWMNSAYTSSGTGFWFFCSWLPLLIGVSLIVLGSLSNSSRWLHVRVKQPGEFPSKIAISFPIPTHFTAWLVRTFGRFIPGLDNTALDEIILALDRETSESPFYIQVNEGEDGEQVEVFIG
jgi:polyhydroxyalkanoate synthesis regulator phasin